MKIDILNCAANATDAKSFNDEKSDKTIPPLPLSLDSNSTPLQFLFDFINQLIQLIVNLSSKIEALTEENSKLREKVDQPKKNSKNSSIPNSKDRYPAKKATNFGPDGKPIKGKPGAKKNHEAHHRKKTNPKKEKPGDLPLEIPGNELPTEEIEILPEFTDCPKCGAGMAHCPDKDHHKEQIELVPNPLVQRRYTMMAFKCQQCGEIHYGAEPATLGTGLLGPTLIALLAFLNGVGHISFTGLQRYLAIQGLNVCRGFICKCLDKCSTALERAYNEVKDALPSQELVYADETGHRENGKRPWTWALRTKLFAFFAIRIDRATTVLEEFLGQSFKGIISCDYFGAYQKFLRLFPGVKAQFCLAHLKRDIQFLIDHLSNRELNGYGTKLMDLLNELFDKTVLWRRLRRQREPDDPDDPELTGEAREVKARNVLEDLREIAKRFKEVALNPPNIKKAKNIAKRFLDWPQDFYFTFLTDDGIAVDLQPTNNFAEQIVRFVVQDRHVTQGTRSINGRTRSERFWTVIATCSLQGRSAFEFFKKALLAHYCKNEKYPSLLDKD
jgi:transposase-like protein